MAVVAFLVVLRKEGGFGGGSIEGIVSFLVGQFAADVHHRDPFAAVDPVSERQDMVLAKELVAVVFGSFELFADVVLEEAGADGLVDLVDPPGVSSAEPNAEPVVGLEEGRLASEVVQGGGSREVAQDVVALGHRVHEAVRVPGPELVLLSVTALTGLGSDVVSGPDIAGGL